ncbi:hypothetical protein PHYBOEH_007035 [Phytophthora boehmeriae]|uniref:Uncharacterized protein n=1 Tax=Phytophthora boehmeriae TaxID=109152 RepID=A0A8T1WAZ1_9STRA|nr:hypothetical protein PHYBOEH_007035 [Phytophthora boehmeriae]
MDRIEFSPLQCTENYIDTWTNLLKVTLSIQSEDQLLKTREALALLSAVARVDQDAWKFLLLQYCGVTLEEVGNSSFERQVPAEFILFMDLEGQNSSRENRLDLVKLCGVHQREHPRQNYLTALHRIAALNKDFASVGRRVDIKVPVRVHTSSCQDTSLTNVIAAVKEIQRQEKVIREEWSRFADKDILLPGTIRCTLVLEPMVLDFLCCMIAPEMAQTVENLAVNNVWASQTTLRLQTESSLEKNQHEFKRVFGQLLLNLFDSSVRSREIINAGCPFNDDMDAHEPNPRQFGKVLINCDVRLESVDMPALFSALAVCQTTKEVTIRIDAKFYNEETGIQFWKWVAYAFFSVRAHSSVESLTLTEMNLVSRVEADAFSAMLTSDHPEEDLFGSPRGEIASRDATLKGGAPIRWSINAQGQVIESAKAMSFESPIQFVRTFSDCGKGKWVNVLVPGLGRCQVQRDDLVFDQASEVESRPHGVSSFTIRFHGFLMFGEDCLELVLAAVASSLKHVKIVCPTDRLDVSSVVENCPYLESMELWRGHINVWYDFKDFHAINQAPTALNVDGWQVDTLASDLCLTDSPSTKSVRRLLVRRLSPSEFGIVYYDSNLQAEIEAILLMLDVNKSLERLDIHLSTPYHRYLSAFKEHHLEPVDQTVKLPNAAKIAFLSVISSEKSVMEAKRPKYEEMGAGHPICELDQSVLSRIFELAHAPVLREVYVELIQDGYPEGMFDEG